MINYAEFIRKNFSDFAINRCQIKKHRSLECKRIYDSKTSQWK